MTTARNECVAWNPCNREGTMQCVDGSGDYTCICRTVGYFSYFGKNCSMSKCHICIATYITYTRVHTHCTYMHTYGMYTHAYIHTCIVPALTHTHTTHAHSHHTRTHSHHTRTCSHHTHTRGRRGGETAATDMTSPVANCEHALYIVIYFCTQKKIYGHHPW